MPGTSGKITGGAPGVGVRTLNPSGSLYSNVRPYKSVSTHRRWRATINHMRFRMDDRSSNNTHAHTFLESRFVATDLQSGRVDINHRHVWWYGMSANFTVQMRQRMHERDQFRFTQLFGQLSPELIIRTSVFEFRVFRSVTVRLNIRSSAQYPHMFSHRFIRVCRVFRRW